MTINLSETTKSDVYAVAQDLAQRLERQKALNDVLRAELAELAARPCLACATLPTPNMDLAFFTAETERLRSENLRLNSIAAEAARLRTDIADFADRPTLPDAQALLAALQQADRLLDGAIRHRKMARDTDPVARMQADEGWPHFLRLVDEWRQNTSTLAQKGA